MVSTDKGTARRLNDDYPEFEWLVLHENELGIHAGSWVAIGPQGLVAVCPDLAGVIEQARGTGLEAPFVHFVKDPTLRRMHRVAW
jgi:hypothetical protein